MADDRSKTNGADRKRVAADQGYEVSYFARKHDLSSEEARTLIERFGNNREKLNVEAEKIATSGRSGRRANRRGAGPTDKRDSRPQSRSRVDGVRSSALTRVAAVGGLVAAGVLFWSRRVQVGDQITRLLNEVTGRRLRSEGEGDLMQGRSGDAFQNPPGASFDSHGRSQADIAAEALTLKETGRAHRGD
jgi:hypothetical protein